MHQGSELAGRTASAVPHARTSTTRATVLEGPASGVRPDGAHARPSGEVEPRWKG